MSTPANILLINGPNLNLLGTREPHIYGSDTLLDVVSTAKAVADKHGAQFADFQSNHKGAIVDRIQQAREQGVTGIVINPARTKEESVRVRKTRLGQVYKRDRN
ncbi:Dehydroquinase [Mucidula mucida]|nr:Dehydroquinase [Mucidula mucida]